MVCSLVKCAVKLYVDSWKTEFS